MNDEALLDIYYFTVRVPEEIYRQVETPTYRSSYSYRLHVSEVGRRLLSWAAPQFDNIRLNKSSRLTVASFDRTEQWVCLKLEIEWGEPFTDEELVLYRLKYDIARERKPVSLIGKTL